MIDQSTLHNLDWEQILEIDLHIYNTLPRKHILAELKSALNLLFFYDFNLEAREECFDFLFFKSMERDDYKELFDKIISSCNHSKKSIDLIPRQSKILRLYRLFPLRRTFSLLKKFGSRNLLKTAFILSKTLFYLSVSDNILKNNQFNHLVVFADMQPIDNLLTQICNLMKIPTTTLQHGIYIDYSKAPNINKVNYENSPSNTFLAWGDSTGQLIKQYHPLKRIVVCGKPTLANITSSNKSNYFTVLFDQNLMAKKNREMLTMAYEISKETGLRVNIRLHPRNNPLSYQIRKSSPINQDVFKSHFILAHTTSLIHELMRLGFPVFKYDTDIPSITVPDELKFSSTQEFFTKLNTIEKNQIQPESLASDFIATIGDSSLMEYKQFFDSAKVSITRT